MEELGRYYPGCVGELVAELEVVGTRSIILLEDAKQRHPAYAQLVGLLERGAVDALILRDTSRLGRELALVATLVLFLVVGAEEALDALRKLKAR